MDLFDKVSEDIKNAMKAKDKVALETLRNIKKFFIEAKTASGTWNERFHAENRFLQYGWSFALHRDRKSVV